MIDNPIIKKRFDEKMKRMDKTSESILISWAINNATNSLTEKQKTSPEWFKLVQERYPLFIEEYRAWILKQETDRVKEQIKKVEVAANWDEKKQEIYNEDSELEELRVEANKL